MLVMFCGQEIELFCRHRFGGCTFLVAAKHLSFLPFLAKRDKRFLPLPASFTHWHANATRHQQQQQQQQQHQ